MSTFSPNAGASPLLPDSVTSTQQSPVPASVSSVADMIPRRIILPTRYTSLEPPLPLSAFNDDPLFNPRAAAEFLGVTVDAMEMWRRRNQGPDYYQYGEHGPVRYALSALLAFRESFLVRTGDHR